MKVPLSVKERDEFLIRAVVYYDFEDGNED